MKKVLIANRGEIAVRVARACRDAGITSRGRLRRPRPRRPARPEPPTRPSPWAAPPRPRPTWSSTSCSTSRRRSGADAVHPGYGFLSENADFAQAVIDAGLTWIGPPPQAIRDLGDKVTARHIAARAGAPLVRGTADPVTGADEVVAFAAEHGLPVAIKAAFGGGGRGLKVARTLEEIPELYDSAVREAVAAFGRGECFVERYLDSPRHVETQFLADQHGNVVVVSTRDCSLQRRHQKLVEEAPAPFLTDEQVERLYASSKAICARPATTAPARASSWSGRTGRSRSSRSTPGCRSSTRSPRRSPASTWSASSSASPTARSSATTTRRCAGTPSSSGSTARTRAATSCPRPAR